MDVRRVMVLRFICLSLLIAGLSALSGASAQVPEDLSCISFSTDPMDQSGPPIHFQANLWDGPQRAPTTSDATGVADFVLERDTLRLSWTVTFDSLTSEPIGLHVHGPVPAEGLAPIIFPLVDGDIESPVRGERTLTTGEVSILVQNWAYVNLHTQQYPEGEIRGGIKKQRPEC